MIDVEEITVGYGSKIIIEELSVAIPKGQITTIIGPNGCGKSTLLKTISRILQASHGAVFIDQKAIHETSTKEIAKKMAILPQTAEAPDGLTVFELVAYGRFPHQSSFGRLKKEDIEAIDWALEATNLTEFQERPIQALSGGQRQRVWIAMALAQDTDILILDEPTTYLDMAHQLDVLQLVERLNKEQGKTIVMVLHDINHASRFSDFLIAMYNGEIVTEGIPERVVTCEHLQQIFQIQAILSICPFSQKPICLSYGKLNTSVL